MKATEEIEKHLIIRHLKEEDIESIVEIDYKILGERRPSYYRRKLFESSESPVISLVAELNGKVVGFIVGTLSGWEFGVPSSFGWIDTIGVDPEWQRRGIGSLLFKKLLEEFANRGVKKVYTLVNWDEWDLLSFFKKMGFKRGDLINLEYDLS